MTRFGALLVAIDIDRKNRQESRDGCPVVIVEKTASDARGRESAEHDALLVRHQYPELDSINKIVPINVLNHHARDA